MTPPTTTPLEDEARSVSEVAIGGSWVDPPAGNGAVDEMDDESNVIEILASYGAAWLVDHLRPLQEILDHLAGQPDAIRACSQAWLDASARLAGVGDEWARACVDDTATWTGEAADAYRAFAAEQASAVRACGLAAKGIGIVVVLVAEALAQIRAEVRALLVDLVQRLIQWLIASMASVGLVGAAAADAVEPAVQDTNNKIIGRLDVLQGTFDRADGILAALLRIFTESDASVTHAHRRKKQSTGKSKRGKHERGATRKSRDEGGERGDDRRRGNPNKRRKE
ncbi:hypothetical protein [Actinophytocola xanthii]|uniref:PPE family domain-containing protein n=1 Tax=Actinophytocola xanthii TaxID=1912961 RepID=A0A1Q8BWD3_9PSEU|nr:hypothetical protein [Actinophytocola xanthii]OLF06423.1 hypothetical protein BU204_36345 [Actinophytocola xanthii]